MAVSVSRGRRNDHAIRQRRPAFRIAWRSPSAEGGGMTMPSDNAARHRRQEVRQAVKNACDQLNSDGVAPRDYVEQLAWLFFLKAFDETEDRREQEADFDDGEYRRRLNGEFRWASWANRTDHPDDMLRFVNDKLWQHLRDFGNAGETRRFASDPVAGQFRRIFSSVRNHSRRGASFTRCRAAGEPAALLGPDRRHRPVRAVRGPAEARRRRFPGLRRGVLHATAHHPCDGRSGASRRRRAHL